MVEQFEAEVAREAGTEFGIATTSATTAMHLCLAALGIGSGDEVLVSDFTFPATANAVIQSGATPVFIDCSPGTFAADPNHAEALIGPRTRAVLLVHPFGYPADLPAFRRLAEERGLFLLEDAACALGSSISGMICGGSSVAGCFSFHPRKLITTGEGGMITTNDEAFASRCRMLRSHGGQSSSPGQPMRFILNGFNYRLSEISAAVGLAQLPHLREFIEVRENIAKQYLKRLKSYEWVSKPPVPSNAEPVYQSFVVMLDPAIERNSVIAEMRQEGVETTVGTYSLHRHPAFERFSGARLSHSDCAESTSLALPMFVGLSDDEVAKSLEVFEAACSRCM